MNYIDNFFTNLTYVMERKGLSKADLARSADLSFSFVSDLTNRKGNPSLKVMSQIAEALDFPLPILLLDPEGEINALLSFWSKKYLEPKVYYSIEKDDNLEEVSAILPKHRAFQVKQWAEEFLLEEKNKRK